MTKFNHDEWIVQHSADRFTEQAETMAQRLRNIADEIERDAKRIVEDADRESDNEVNRASWIVNAINSTFANLNTQDLVVRASELKDARNAVETDES